MRVISDAVEHFNRTKNIIVHEWGCWPWEWGYRILCNVIKSISSNVTSKPTLLRVIWMGKVDANRTSKKPRLEKITLQNGICGTKINFLV